MSALSILGMCWPKSKGVCVCSKAKLISARLVQQKHHILHWDQFNNTLHILRNNLETCFNQSCLLSNLIFWERTILPRNDDHCLFEKGQNILPWRTLESCLLKTPCKKRTFQSLKKSCKTALGVCFTSQGNKYVIVYTVKSIDQLLKLPLLRLSKCHF